MSCIARKGQNQFKNILNKRVISKSSSLARTSLLYLTSRVGCLNFHCAKDYLTEGWSYACARFTEMTAKMESSFLFVNDFSKTTPFRSRRRTYFS